MHKGMVFLGLISIFFLCGCETSKGFATGVGTGLAVTTYGTAKGAVDDTASVWKAIQKADSWIEENLW